MYYRMLVYIGKFEISKMVNYFLCNFSSLYVVVSVVDGQALLSATSLSEVGDLVILVC